MGYCSHRSVDYVWLVGGGSAVDDGALYEASSAWTSTVHQRLRLHFDIQSASAVAQCFVEREAKTFGGSPNYRLRTDRVLLRGDTTLVAGANGWRPEACFGGDSRAGDPLRASKAMVRGRRGDEGAGLARNPRQSRKVTNARGTQLVDGASPPHASGARHRQGARGLGVTIAGARCRVWGGQDAAKRRRGGATLPLHGEDEIHGLACLARPAGAG